MIAKRPAKPARPVRDSRYISVFLPILMLAICSFIFYWRFPENYRYPNFFAEDGSVFLQNLLDKGMLHSLFTPFNGYFIVGLYLVEIFARLINLVLFGSHFVTLAQSFAIASYAFLAFAATLPLMLLRKHWGTWLCIGLALAAALVPLPQTAHLVVGTIGNLKWVFFYIAITLAIHRFYERESLGKKVILVDTGLLICGFTNATAYLAYGLVLISYLPLIKKFLSNKNQQLKNRLKVFAKLDVASCLMLGFLLLLQLVYIKLNGIPKINGYLTDSFNHKEFVEIYFARTLVFDFFHPFYSSLSNALAVVLSAIYVGACWFLLRGKDRIISLFCIVAAVLATAAFALNRPGVSSEFYNYTTSGPDQFFYGQNLVAYVPLFLIVKGFSQRFTAHKSLKLLPVLAVVLLLSANYLSSARFRYDNVMESSASTYVENALTACHKQSGPTIATQNYPLRGADFFTRVPRSSVCNSYFYEHYRPAEVQLGLQPRGNNFLLIGQAPVFYQTFKATESKLNGIDLFVSTFQAKRLNNNYDLVLSDSSCRHIINRSRIGFEVFDNSYYRVHFPQIDSSKGQTYCFSVEAANPAPLMLAVQVSQPGQYSAGSLREGTHNSQGDIVFNPLYSTRR